MASSALSVAVRELHKAPASAQRAAAATWGFDLNYAWGDSMAAYRAGEHDPVACVKDCKAANRWFSKATAARANYETNYPQ